MTLEESLARERKNKNQIWLQRDKEFLAAVEMSAYLLRKNFWPDLKVVLKSHPKQGEYLRVGFIITSLHKVETQVRQSPKMRWETEMVDGEIKGIRITGLEEDLEGFQLWKQEYLAAQHQAKQQMQPFYGALPVYKLSYDLMSLIITTSRTFPKELQATLGVRLVDEIVEINSIFRRICQSKDERHKLDGLIEIQDRTETVVFLLRLAFDQKAYGLERSCDLVEKLGNIKLQLRAWRKKFEKQTAN